ncbi:MULTISPECIES: hypothetical protein [unclassified Achromobacter]|uniref:hypothetical protein n=1 Tax=unclassified Achromobacter TaxID=2626865 RepID=UPI000B51929A|nr:MULTISPECIES: hypothetical protein [unclassified Achromobacter]OWT69198.1 hypothetical protein CEY05_28645 [Achromobacter sp. HZ34]OWT70603.1 hypothetical protein CEY04_27475 [Achromobacter sp. HZ28]
METGAQELIGGYGSLIAVIGLVLSSAWTTYKNNKLDRSANSAVQEGWTRLSSLLEKAEARARLAEERADMFAKERNDLVLELGELRGEVARLRGQVELLTRELAQRGLTNVANQQG